jgi:transposase-like protein
MIGLVIILLCVIGIGVTLFLNMDTGPSVCPNCKKEYEKAEDWSYGDYSWGKRCPHCKYEFDITP